MNYKRNIIIVSSYILIVCMFFAVGYTAGSKRTRTAVAGNVQNTSAWVEQSEELPYYTVELKNSNIMLYKHFMGGTELIYMKNIMTAIYPKDDIEQLKEGIKFDSIEEAKGLIENFVS